MFNICNLFDICFSCLDDGDKVYYDEFILIKKNKQIIINQNEEIGLPGII